MCVLQHHVFNFMENAVKYNREEGSVLVTIEKQDDLCVTTISDTGIGMAEEEETIEASCSGSCAGCSGCKH